jgi:hypothetical protein
MQMSSNLPSVFQKAAPSTLVAGREFEKASADVTGGYGVLKFKGKVWTLHYKGKRYPFMRPDGDGPRNSLDVIVVRSAGTKSKTYYPTFNDGDSAKPTCWSNDARKPDPSVPKPIHTNCHDCPMNVIGSKTNTETGAKSKACADQKRVAVVIDPAIVASVSGLQVNEPVLLRLPAASLNPFGTYGDVMETQKWPLISVLTRLSFEPAFAYPKLKFEAVRPLTDDEVSVALELRDGAEAVRIVSSEVDAPAAADEGEIAPSVFINEREGVAPDRIKVLETAPAPKEEVQPPPPKAAAPAPAPKEKVEEAEIVADEAVDDLDAKIKNILGE